ncbi:Protein of unknown function [Pyronema omphalodes CBS 100304]|uniref:Uncharacterized protein n=1 Tax=Pyronema omphalodes (strain CBS 100304) TaxID=1076935 RepID=U4L4T9_PYROM|nr:Protein of unknown function [Pyronema omphalodes CBS 100304]
MFESSICLSHFVVAVPRIPPLSLRFLNIKLHLHFYRFSPSQEQLSDFRSLDCITRHFKQAQDRALTLGHINGQLGSGPTSITMWKNQFRASVD